MADKTCYHCKHYRIQRSAEDEYTWWCDLDKGNCCAEDCPDWDEDA